VNLLRSKGFVSVLFAVATQSLWSPISYVWGCFAFQTAKSLSSRSNCISFLRSCGFFTFSFQLDILNFDKVLGEIIIAVQMSYETLLESIGQRTIEKAVSRGKRGSMLSICPDDMRRLIMFVKVVDVST